VLIDNQFRRCTWAEVQVGQIVKVRAGESIPADLVLLVSSQANGLCFVETANIDGETNLKIKAIVNAKCDADSIGSFEGVVIAEPPNQKIYEFSGKLILPTGSRHISLGIDNVLLRGTVLRNTAWVYGAVVYTGPDTRIMQGSNDSPPLKWARIDQQVNRQMGLMILVLLGLVAASLLWWWVSTRGLRRKYLSESPADFTFHALLWRCLTYLVLYHSIVPISMLVTMEVCRFHLGTLINDDLGLFDEALGVGAKAANSNLVDDLGQVGYILTDKTGTLTKNEMVLMAYATAGTARRIPLAPSVVMDGDERWLLELLVLCHTVIKDEAGRLQASSPDELAIVHGAARCGAVFVERHAQAVVVELLGKRRAYRLLQLVEFTSQRKRMSVVLQGEADSEVVLLITKGADDVVFERASSTDGSAIATNLQTSIEGFAVAGLRTLCYGYRWIPREEWGQWERGYSQSNSAADKASMIDELERGLTLAGATGVEDRLDAEVPETVQLLRGAGIVFWVLTGDRIETAINIGFACGFLTQPQPRLEGQTGLPQQQQQILLKDASELDEVNRGLGDGPVALIVEGRALESILASHEAAFFRLAMQCEAVICCRVSPLQKALLTAGLQTASQAVCLAIGDGANDVGMIQAARLGVGISGGREGLQAARAADFSLPHFHGLSRLLLVHGSWAYHRLAKTILYCFYKNLVIVTSQLWFAARCLASGQTVYESWMLSLSNVLFTAWLPIVIGVTEQHVSARLLLAYPGLYRRGQANTAFAQGKFWRSALNACLQAAALFVLLGLAVGDPLLASGKAGGFWFFSVTYYACSLLTILYKAAILINAWNVLTAAVLVGGMLSWFGYLIAYDLLSRAFPHMVFLSALAPLLLRSPLFWAALLLFPALVSSKDWLWKFSRRAYLPRDYHIVQELGAKQRRKTAEEAPMAPPGAQKKKKKRSSFAFSQTPGQHALL
jgi:phospholipid-transporting ATPase